MVSKPDQNAPVSFVRLWPKDHMAAKRLAKKEQLPLSTWIRNLVGERLELERAK